MLVLATLPVGAACSALLLLTARRAAPALPLALTLLALVVTTSVRGGEGGSPPKLS